MRLYFFDKNVDQLGRITAISSTMIDIKKQIIDVCKLLHKKNMLAAADGNVSVRISDNEILITPSGVSKAQIGVEDIAVINLEGKILSGKPSSERLMHLQVYQSCPEAQSVVHAHPPHAIAWTVAHPDMDQLPDSCLSEVILAAGRIPFVPYARPSTKEMGDVLRPYLPGCRLLVLSRHGAISWGESLTEAALGMERLEHSAQILYLSKTLNKLTFLPDEEVKALKEMRKTIGPKTL